MESYRELKERQQQEVNNFPLGFAFGNRQFEEMLKKWGLDATKGSDLAQVVSLFAGAYILKKDIPAYKAMCQRHRKELETAIAEDKTGEGFIYGMFLFELNNHEFSFTEDITDSLIALGYTAEQVDGDPRLKRGIKKAAKEITSGRY